MESDIELVSEEEVGTNQRVMEIRFDCFVRIFDMKHGHTTTGLFIKQEVPLKPQWFRSTAKLTLESIKDRDEYEIGRQLKFMLFQLEKHIESYNLDNNK